jgi:hypothetical protein
MTTQNRKHTASNKSFSLFSLTFSFLALFFVSGCGPALVGSGSTARQELSINGVERIVVHHSLDLSITHHEEESAMAVGDENLIPYLEYKQEAKTLHLRLRENAEILRGNLTVALRLPTLRSLNIIAGSRVRIKSLQTKGDLHIELSGMSEVDIEEGKTDAAADFLIEGSSLLKGQFQARSMSFRLTGNSRVVMRLLAETTTFDASGSSWVNFVGEVDELRFHLAGGSKGFFEQLTIDHLDAHLSGNSKGILRHDGTLNALLEGGSRLFYRGQPTLQKIEKTGGSELVPSN